MRSLWHRARLLILAAVLWPLSLPGPAAAQGELVLHVRRNFGFSSGSQIQGSFRLEAVGPENLVSVTFKIDEYAVGTVTTAPFRIDFDTDDYPTGWHALTAVGRTDAGRVLASAPRRFEFLSAQESWAAVGRIVVPLLTLVGVLMLVGVTVAMIQTFGGRGPALPLGAPRRYGFKGGAICPRCGRPFSIHWWSLNLGPRKLDRCEHCGRWSLVRSASQDALRAAEAAELARDAPSTPDQAPDHEARFRQQLDATRYIDDQ